MVSRESDRAVFRELFDRYFQAPAPTGLPLTSALAASPAPVEGQAPQRALDALTPGLLAAQTPQDDLDEETEEDMTADARFSASQRERLQQADAHDRKAAPAERRSGRARTQDTARSFSASSPEGLA